MSKWYSAVWAILMIFVNQELYSGIQQLIFFLCVPLIIVIVHRTICGERGRELQIVNEEGKNCCNCHSYLLYLHCTGFSPMQNSQENQQQHNMQILGCVMLVELRVPSSVSLHYTQCYQLLSSYYYLPIMSMGYGVSFQTCLDKPKMVKMLNNIFF